MRIMLRTNCASDREKPTCSNNEKFGGYELRCSPALLSTSECQLLLLGHRCRMRMGSLRSLPMSHLK